MLIAEYLFDNGIIPIKFGGAISLAILGFMAYSAGKDSDFLRDLGKTMMVVAAIGAFFVAINAL